jgi:UDP-N-acetylmuramoyl-tripeptide--D-alanyl-D-alanine ligase
MNLTTDILGGMLGIAVDESRPVTGAAIDSRLVRENDCFFAMPGERTDGHRHLGEAVRRGASALVIRSDWPEEPAPSKSLLIRVPDPVRALQDVAATWRLRFGFPVIAVTGSNGKTTTKEMIAAVLSARWLVHKSEGNLNNHLGVPLSIASWDGGDAAVLEMGANHFGEIARLCEIARPTQGVITNIGEAHLESFGDLGGVAKAKSELLDFLSVHDGEAFLNGDDGRLARLKNVAPRTQTFGFGIGCDFRAEAIEGEAPEMEIEGRRVRLTIPGRHNLYNALAAALVGRRWDIPWDVIVPALESFRRVDKRMDLVHAGPIQILNDTYNANPGSMRQAIQTLHLLKSSGRRIAALGDMQELGASAETAHRRVGEWTAMSLDALFVFGPLMKHAADEAVRLGMESVFHFKSKAALANELTAWVKPGDAVLVKGSRSMKMEDVVTALMDRFGVSVEE